MDAGRCGNPRCSCSPCSCEDCRCGATRLGELERQVMGILWRDPGRELSARVILEQLPGYAYTTVATVLDRLAHKGEVKRRKEGRSIRYSPTGSGGLHAAKAMREALEEAGDKGDALTSFVAALTSEEAAALREALGAEGRGAGPASLR